MGAVSDEQGEQGSRDEGADRPGPVARPGPAAVPPGWAPVQPPPAYGPPGGGGYGGRAPVAPPGWGPPPGGFPPPPPPPKPGIVALRPLGVSEILDGAISAMRGYPRIMLGLSAVVAAAAQLLTLPLTWLLMRDSADAALRFSRPTTPQEDVTFAASALTATGVQLVVTLVATLVLTGVLTIVVSRAVLGRPVTTRDAWAGARPRVPALLGVTLLVTVIELGVGTAALAPGALLALGGAPTVVTGLAFAVGIPAFLAFGSYLYVAFALAPPAIVLEHLPVRASLRRSRQLVRGAWWRTFGILLLVNVLSTLLANILAVPFQLLAMLLAFLTGDGLNIYALLPLLVTSLGTILGSAVTWPFTAVSTALLYVDRRMRREALDVDLARAAGVPSAGRPVPRG